LEEKANGESLSGRSSREKGGEELETAVLL
jgi:hypothetical protein